MQDNSNTITLTVAGLPPAKNEAKSMLGLGHPHLPRARVLLEAALDTSGDSGPAGFGSQLVSVEVVLRTPGDPPSDLTNYLGGVTDVLENKAHRGPLHHLADLASVFVYDNDRQVREASIRHERGESGYAVTIRSL